MTFDSFNMVIALFGGGFILGWITSNFIYGRQDCKECFIALIRGKGCSMCEYNPPKKEVEK